MTSPSPHNPTEMHELEPQANGWGGVTDPSLHDPKNFRYLVHAINPFSQMNALTITLYDARDGIKYDEAWGDQKISMYDQPERLAERVSLSMSLIDQDHTGTWGEAGLIVEAPEHNVVLTSESDAGAHNNNLDFLMTQADKKGVMAGGDLLRYSSPSSYNEVVAVANRDGSELKLKGFFYKATKGGDPYNKQLANRIQMHATRLGLPVIAVTEQSPYDTDKVEQRDGKLSVQYNGHRFLLTGYEPKQQFRAYDERGYSRFVAPHEAETAVGFAVASGNITPEDAQNVLEEYEAADLLRQTPKVTFNEDGSVKEVTQNTGYGVSEEKVSIGKAGHGYRTNLAKQAEKMQDAMLNMEPQMIGLDEDRSYRPISPAEADKMIEQACGTLDADKASLVKTWFAEHRKVLAKQWEYHLSSLRTLGGYSLELT